MQIRQDDPLARVGRRSEDAERLAHDQLDERRWGAAPARWFVLGQEALTADGRRAWAASGAPRRRADDLRH